MNKGVGGPQEVISNYSKWKCGLMIAFTRADGRIQLVNWEWERTLGWTLDEIQDSGIDVFRRVLPRTAASPGGKWGSSTWRGVSGSIADLAHETDGRWIRRRSR